MKTYKRPSRTPRPKVVGDTPIRKAGINGVQVIGEERFSRFIVQVGGNANARRAFVHNVEKAGAIAWRIESTGREVATYEIGECSPETFVALFGDNGEFSNNEGGFWIEGEPMFALGIRPPNGKAQGSGAPKVKAKAPNVARVPRWKGDYIQEEKSLDEARKDEAHTMRPVLQVK